MSMNIMTLYRNQHGLLARSTTIDISTLLMIILTIPIRKFRSIMAATTFWIMKYCTMKGRSTPLLSSFLRSEECSVSSSLLLS